MHDNGLAHAKAAEYRQHAVFRRRILCPVFQVRQRRDAVFCRLAFIWIVFIFAEEFRLYGLLFRDIAKHRGFSEISIAQARCRDWLPLSGWFGIGDRTSKLFQVFAYFLANTSREVVLVGFIAFLPKFQECFELGFPPKRQTRLRTKLSILIRRITG